MGVATITEPLDTPVHQAVFLFAQTIAASLDTQPSPWVPQLLPLAQLFGSQSPGHAKTVSDVGAQRSLPVAPGGPEARLKRGECAAAYPAVNPRAYDQARCLFIVCINGFLQPAKAMAVH